MSPKQNDQNHDIAMHDNVFFMKYKNENTDWTQMQWWTGKWYRSPCLGTNMRHGYHFHAITENCCRVTLAHCRKCQLKIYYLNNLEHLEGRKLFLFTHNWHYQPLSVCSGFWRGLKHLWDSLCSWCLHPLKWTLRQMLSLKACVRPQRRTTQKFQKPFLNLKS